MWYLVGGVRVLHQMRDPSSVVTFCMASLQCALDLVLTCLMISLCFAFYLLVLIFCLCMCFCFGKKKQRFFFYWIKCWASLFPCWRRESIFLILVPFQLYQWGPQPRSTLVWLTVLAVARGYQVNLLPSICSRCFSRPINSTGRFIVELYKLSCVH